MFADELIALHEVCPDADITYIANLEERGLPKVRRDAERIGPHLGMQVFRLRRSGHSMNTVQTERIWEKDQGNKT